MPSDLSHFRKKHGNRSDSQAHKIDQLFISGGYAVGRPSLL